MDVRSQPTRKLSVLAKRWACERVLNRESWMEFESRALSNFCSGDAIENHVNHPQEDGIDEIIDLQRAWWCV